MKYKKVIAYMRKHPKAFSIKDKQNHYLFKELGINPDSKEDELMIKEIRKYIDIQNQVPSGDSPLSQSIRDKQEEANQFLSTLEAQDEEYEFARESKYQNLGEDIKASARHNRGVNHLEDIENGNGEKLIKREKLLKELELELDEDNLQQSLFQMVALKQFPPQPNVPTQFKKSSDDTMIEFRDYNGHKEPMELGEYKKELQKDYLDTFNQIKDITDKETLTSRDKIDMIKDLLNNKIAELRKGDKFNALANQYVNYLNDTVHPFYQKKKTTTPLRTLENVNSLEEAEKIINPKAKKKRREYAKPIGRDYLPAEERKGRTIPKTYEDQAKYMMEKCKFKAIQWGQSVSDNERRENMKALTESITDLSDSLGIPEDKLSIGGELSLAVGARGKGFSKASAHYEPSHKIINLTRKEGSGALAHEYFHSLDNLISKKQNNGEWLTDKPNEKMAKFQKAIYSHRERIAKDIGSVGYSKKEFNYWVNDQKELFARCGERYIQDKMKEKGISNNHLCGLGNNPCYPNDEEWEKIKPVFEDLFEDIKKKL